MKNLIISLGLFISLSIFGGHHKMGESHNAHSSQDGSNPFVMIARLTVKPGMVEQYLNIADEVDKTTKLNEPGMLFHNFDADPDNALGFNWTEVYSNSKALVIHLTADYALEYVGKHNELADSFSIEIYGDLSKEAIEAVLGLGLPFKHFKTTRVGYVRENKFN